MGSNGVPQSLEVVTGEVVVEVMLITHVVLSSSLHPGLLGAWCRLLSTARPRSYTMFGEDIQLEGLGCWTLGGVVGEWSHCILRKVCLVKVCTTNCPGKKIFAGLTTNVNTLPFFIAAPEQDQANSALWVAAAILLL